MQLISMIVIMPLIAMDLFPSKYTYLFICILIDLFSENNYNKFENEGRNLMK